MYVAASDAASFAMAASYKKREKDTPMVTLFRKNLTGHF